jgi:hypothetical protein
MSREIMQQALDALKWIANVNAMDYEYQRKARDSIKTLEQELVKSEQELPTLRQVVIESALKGYGKPEQAPLKREWVGLTDSDMQTIRDDAFVKNVDDIAWALQMARRIEAKLKEKNGIA